ncbi:MAG: ATP-dependent helicase [Acidimicrobiales bacterium]|nr:ATP-dependent helicase [Acidimicrobiales bacterium]
MPDVMNLLTEPGVETVFVAGDLVREGRLALWRAGDGRAGGGRARELADGPTGPGDAGDTIDVVLPARQTLRRRSVPVTWVPIREGIDALVALPAASPAARSTHAWAHAARAALQLVARGRVLPTADADGTDVWRVGPLDTTDVAHWQALARALPALAHAVELPGSAPRRVASPAWLLARFRDAVADAYVRTAAAADAAGHVAFASHDRVAVAGSATWLTATGTAATTEVTVALRVDLGPDRGPDAPGGEREPQPQGIGAAGSGPNGRERGSIAGHGPGDRPAIEDVAVAPRGTEPRHDARQPTAGHGAAAGDGGGDFRAVLQIGSRRDPSLVLDAAELWAAPDAVATRFGPDVEEQVLLALRRGARVWEPISRLLAEARPDALDLGPAEIDQLLGPLADDLAGSGIDVLWPAGLLAPVKVTPTVTSAALTADRASGLGLDGLCELRWTATVDGEQLTDDELHELATAKRAVIRLRGRWVRADPDRLAHLTRRRRVSTGSALAAALGGDLEVDGETVAATVEGPIADLARRLKEASEQRDIEPPGDLQAELRPYQRQGVSWLANMAEIGFGGILADDMGLGKTVQLLALHLLRRPTGKPTLVVCPVSVVANWSREAARFAPSVPVVRFHGTTRNLDDLPPDALVVTTYGVVRRQADRLAALHWGLVAADEAQNIKNPMSRTARAIRQIPADARFALTGTPVENRLVDLWALLDWTTPGLLGPLDRFRHEVAIPVERDQDPDAAASLARLVRPFVLRRRKIDPGIAPELPPKTETDRIVALTAEQATLYAAMVDEIMDQVENAEGMKRRGLVLKLLSGLKQICNHPAQFLHQPGPLAARSGKLDAVAELVETIVTEGESVLIFTQFVTMGHLLQRHLSSLLPPPRPDVVDGGRTTPAVVEFLHGSVPLARRQEMVDRLQSGETRVLVISVKAGGTGLNLTRATHVVHFDRWWNPAVEDQASDRAWRIGQDRPVQVHRMICEGTVEDRIAQMLTSKRNLADSVVTTGEGWVGEMGDDDLRALVALGADDGWS